MTLKTVKSILFLAALFLSNCVSAEAYKCMKGGRPVYQGTPCEVNSTKGTLDIKEQTPEEKATALEKLQEIRREYKASEEMKHKADDHAIQQDGNGQPQSALPAPAQEQSDFPENDTENQD